MDQQLLDRILKCERLPSFPAIAARVVEMCGDENVSVRELGEVLSHDTAISTKILRTINSSFYGLRHRVTTVERATGMLGINAVKMLALGFSLVPQLKGLGGEDFDPTIIWKRSLFAAVGAHTIAREVKFNHYEEAFIAGLLQDLGVIVLLQTLRGDYAKIISQAIDEHNKLRVLEQQKLDLTHTEVGYALADQWGLPPILTAAIGGHESPDEAAPEYQALVRSVTLGAKAADCFLCSESQRAGLVKSYIQHASLWFDLDNEKAAAYLEEIEVGTKELGKLFEIESSSQQSASDLMELANEVLSDLSVKAIQEISVLEEENEHLSEQAHYDPLASTLNRGGLDQMLSDEFEAAGKTGKSMSVIFFDIDKFKDVNDNYGHHVGDRVLRLVASLMNESVSPGGRVGRYGGDEFTMVLPGVDGEQAGVIAENLRRRIEKIE
ncbi:MAG: GGDEF domain-containing protein, partial [Opitutaceae bacterium]|nr:GGDEF domain-containing protein [Opitutaceae bacterium]